MKCNNWVCLWKKNGECGIGKEICDYNTPEHLAELAKRHPDKTELPTVEQMEAVKRRLCKATKNFKPLPKNVKDDGREPLGNMPSEVYPQ